MAGAVGLFTLTYLFMIELLIVFALILTSAFFSGSETGLTSVARAKIHNLKMAGNRKAIIVSRLREDKERMIGAILLGNNAVNIAASAIATSLAITYFGESGVVYATVIMTVLVLVFAEVMPKTYAVRHAEQVSLLVAPFLQLIVKILSPVTAVVQLLVNRIISVISMEPQEQMTGVEVLRGEVELSHEEGEVQKDDKDMLSGIFNLGDTEVEQIMVHRSDMVTINADEPVEKIISFVANSSRSRIPVWKDSPDNIIGVVHAKDLFKAAQNHQGDLSSIAIQPLIREAWFVPETTMLKNQLKAFQEHQKHIALVVDEFGSVSGVITLEDIIEEVVGEIEDEHDETPGHIRMRTFQDGSYSVDGDISIRDLNREFNWGLSGDNATTLAGYVMAIAQRIPDEKEIFEIDDFMFKILKKEGNQITRIKVRKTSEVIKPGEEVVTEEANEDEDQKPSS